LYRYNKDGFDVVAFAHSAVSAGEDLELRARRLASALAPPPPPRTRGGGGGGGSGRGRGVGFDMLEARVAAATRGESFPLLTPPPLPGDRRRMLVPAQGWALSAVREW
jgi:hypothetical protein